MVCQRQWEKKSSNQFLNHLETLYNEMNSIPINNVVGFNCFKCLVLRLCHAYALAKCVTMCYIQEKIIRCCKVMLNLLWQILFVVQIMCMNVCLCRKAYGQLYCLSSFHITFTDINVQAMCASGMPWPICTMHRIHLLLAIERESSYL